jgi:hypothetical protein
LIAITKIAKLKVKLNPKRYNETKEIMFSGDEEGLKIAKKENSMMTQMKILIFKILIRCGKQ